MAFAPSFRVDASLRFGRRRGWVLHHFWSLARRVGLFHRLEAIDWSRVRRLVFVCRGNICRSAYAEQRARATGMPSASFGLEARRGREADETAIRVANRRGVNLGNHRARPLSEYFPQAGDLLVAMEPSQMVPLLRRERRAPAQLTLLGLWSAPARPYLQDPHGLGMDYFHTCFGCIDSAIENIGARVVLGVRLQRNAR